MNSDYDNLISFENEINLISILNTMPTPIAFIDKSYKYEYINDTYCQYFKKTQNEIIGHSVFDLFDNDEFNNIIKPHLERCFSGEYVDYQHWFTFPDNIQKYLNAQYTPFRNDKHEIIGAVVHIDDITDKKKAEESLKQSEKKYRYVVDYANIGIVVIQDGVRVFDNPKVRDMLGYTKEEYEKIDFISNIYEADRDFTFNRIKKRYLGEKLEPEYIETRLIKKNGELIWVQAYSRVIEWEGKKALQAFIIEITEKKKAEELLKQSEKKLSDIINHSDEIFFIHDCDNQLQYVSPQSEKIFGYTQEEMMFNWTNLITENPINDIGFKNTMKAIETGEKQEPYFLETNKKDGKIIMVKINESPLKNEKGDVIGITGMCSDVTDELKAVNDLKKANESMKNMNVDLEEKVKERTQEIEKLLIQKDQFINQLGHDLKHPLGPMLNLLPILKKNETDSYKLEIIETIIRNSDHMRNLVKKTIELARLNSSNIEFNFHEIDFVNVLNKTIESNKLRFEENGIIIEKQLSSDLPKVEADETYVQELLTNLIDNAVKYMESSGKITLKGIVDDDFLTVSIKDNGIGLTEYNINYVFNEFYKADESRHDIDSCGLGMSICKRIVEKHGGKIWVESDGIGKGTTVNFTLKISYR